MISIIGAGPAGNYLAYLLAKKGKEVNVYEDHKEIGKPIQCTGIISHELKNILPIKKKFLTNTINKAKIYSPNGKSIKINFKEKDYIVNRTDFDSYLGDLAMSKGANYNFNHRFKENKGKKMKINDKVIETDILIGADGPYSRVAKSNGMWCNRKFVTGNQVTVKVNCDPNLVEFWVGIGLFGWLVPENESVARVGIVSYDKPQDYLNRLLKMRCSKAKVLSKEPGSIPLYNPKQTLQKGNVYLIGDAATQVKATSFGGIIHHLKAAEILAKNMKNYERNCKKEVGRDLYLSLLMRKTMDKFSEKDYNDLILMFQKKKLSSILEKNSRDFPTKFILKMLLTEPRLLKFGLKALS